MQRMSHLLSRREALAGLAAGLSTLGGCSTILAAEKTQMGLADFSYIVRQRKEKRSVRFPRFSSTLEMLEHLHEIGYGGLQAPIRGWSSEVAKTLRAKCERYGMYLEGQTGLPKSDSDAAAFSAQLESAKAAGASVVRTVFTGARRYEFFESAEQFKKFREDSWAALKRAEPVAAKLGIRLAIENHKDLRSEELVEVLTKISSEFVGVNFDTGNNVALLEEAGRTAELLAPHAFTLHLKDVAIEEYDEGFLLSEVALGEGMLDLKSIVALCRRHNPSVRFNLEMPARDPLKVPVLTKKYQATFTAPVGSTVEGLLTAVRKRKSLRPLPRVSQLPFEEQLDLEENQILKCAAYARAELGL